MENSKRQMNILVVEDDGDFGKVISEYLEDLGHHVIVAARGKCASRMFEKIPIDISLIDVSLPDMSGLDIIRWLKSEKRLTEIPIIIISGRSGLKDKLEGFLTGAERYLSKPFELEELSETIDMLLQAKEGNKTGSGDLKTDDACLAKGDRT